MRRAAAPDRRRSLGPGDPRARQGNRPPLPGLLARLDTGEGPAIDPARWLVTVARPRGLRGTALGALSPLAAEATRRSTRARPWRTCHWRRQGRSKLGPWERRAPARHGNRGSQHGSIIRWTHVVTPSSRALSGPAGGGTRCPAAQVVDEHCAQRRASPREQKAARAPPATMPLGVRAAPALCASRFVARTAASTSPSP